MVSPSYLQGTYALLTPDPRPLLMGARYSFFNTCVVCKLISPVFKIPEMWKTGGSW